MLLSKIKEIKNGRVIVKDSKAKDDTPSEEAYDRGYAAAKSGLPSSANPYSDVSRSGYGDLKSSWEEGWKEGNTTNDSKMKDVEPSSEQIGKIVGLVMSSEKDPTRAIAMIQNKISSEFHLSMEEREKLLPQIKMAISVYNNSSKDSKTKDGYQEIHMQINKLQDELEGLEGEENTPYYKSLVKQIEQLEKKLETQDSKIKDKLFDLGNYKGVRIYEGTENKTDKFFTHGEGHASNIGYLAGYTLNELKSKIDAAIAKDK